MVKTQNFSWNLDKKNLAKVLEVSRAFRWLARMLSKRARTWEGNCNRQDGGSETKQSSSFIQAQKQV